MRVLFLLLAGLTACSASATTVVLHPSGTQLDNCIKKTRQACPSIDVCTQTYETQVFAQCLNFED